MVVGRWLVSEWLLGRERGLGVGEVCCEGVGCFVLYGYFLRSRGYGVIGCGLWKWFLSMV